VFTSLTATTATVLSFPNRPTFEHPTWCDSGACEEFDDEPGFGYHVAPGAGVLDRRASLFWSTELRAPFLPGYTTDPEVHVRVIDLDEPEIRVNQSVRPRAGSREEARLAGAVLELEERLRMTMTITLGTHTAGSVG